MRMKLYLCLGATLFLVGCGGEEATPEKKEVAAPSVSIPMRSFRTTGKKQNPDRPDSIPLAEGSFSTTTYEAEIIDTTKFDPQISPVNHEGEYLTASMFRPADPEAPGIGPAARNNVQLDGGLADMNRVAPGLNFPGITEAEFTPPDPTIAAGPNHIVQMVNSEIAFFQKDGVKTFQNRLGSTGSPGFFETVGGGNFCIDPRCFFDHNSQRFVVMCLEVYFNTNESYLTIAVSDDDDPNGIWFKYRPFAVFDISGTDFWADYPSMGYDDDGYYISGNLFSFNFSFGGVGIRTMDKTPMLTGDPLVVRDLVITNIATVQMSQMFGNSGPTPHGVSIQNGRLVLLGINNPFTSPSLTTRFVTIPGFTESGNAANGSGSASTVGSRAMNAHSRNGQLYTCHSVQRGPRTACRWYQVNLNNFPNGNPTLNQSGEVDLGGTTNAFFPAIYSDENENVAMTFARSSGSELISVNAVGRMATDPPGTMGNPVQFEVSSAVANGRYGDYFDISIDPSNGFTFWLTGEIMAGTNNWDTVINSFVLVAEEVVAVDSFNVTTGILSSGGAGELLDSDNVDVTINRNATSFQARTEFEVGATSPFATPSGIEVTLEGSVFARSNVVQSIALFNYDTDDWEVVDSRNAARFTDSTVNVSVSGDASRFVQPGTNAIEARIRYQSNSPRQQFSSNTDQFSWTIQP